MFPNWSGSIGHNEYNFFNLLIIVRLDVVTLGCNRKFAILQGPCFEIGYVCTVFKGIYSREEWEGGEVEGRERE